MPWSEHGTGDLLRPRVSLAEVGTETGAVQRGTEAAERRGREAVSDVYAGCGGLAVVPRGDTDGAEAGLDPQPRAEV